MIQTLRVYLRLLVDEPDEDNMEEIGSLFSPSPLTFNPADSARQIPRTLLPMVVAPVVARLTLPKLLRSTQRRTKKMRTMMTSRLQTRTTRWRNRSVELYGRVTTQWAHNMSTPAFPFRLSLSCMANPFAAPFICLISKSFFLRHGIRKDMGI